MGYMCRYGSPLGELGLASDGQALVALWFAWREDSPGTLPDECEERPDLPVFDQARAWLDTYFAGENPGPTPLCAPRGSRFRQRVWKVMASIPYGGLVTYGDIAREVEAQTGRRCAAQAVGGAVGHNPIGIILPCHRVIGAGGNLTGYGGGLDVKLALLELEGVDTSVLGMPR